MGGEPLEMSFKNQLQNIKENYNNRGSIEGVDEKKTNEIIFLIWASLKGFAALLGTVRSHSNFISLHFPSIGKGCMAHFDS